MKPMRRKASSTKPRVVARESAEPADVKPVPALGPPVLSPRTSEMQALRDKVAALELELQSQKAIKENQKPRGGYPLGSNPQLMPASGPVPLSRQVANPSPPGVLRPSSFGNSRSSLVAGGERKSASGSRKTSFSSNSSRTETNSPIPFAPPGSESHILGAVDFARVGLVGVETKGDLGTSSTVTTLVSGTSGAVVDVGRVIPAGHKKTTGAGGGIDRFDVDDGVDELLAGRVRSSYDSAETLQSFESSEGDINSPQKVGDMLVENVSEEGSFSTEDGSGGSPHPKTPAGVKRVKSTAAMHIDTTTNDIFSPNNISQGACLEKFGYAPGEIVNKLFLEHAISENEDRLIRYLLARDDRKTLENLMYIESAGITKESIGNFRQHLGKHLHAFKNSPMAKKGMGSRLFFNDDDDDESEDIAPERPDTAIPKDDSSVGSAGGSPQPMIPFQSFIHKVLVKIALRLRELGSGSTREKVILVGSGMYNPLHRLHLRMFYLARQFLEGKSRFEVLGGIVSPCHPTAVRQKFRQRPKEIIPPKHRLAMARLSVGDSAWLTVDPWEITRRRVLDYLSVLDHVREIIDEAFPHEKIRLIYLVDGNTLPKLSVPALQERRCNCLCICRPMAVDILLKQLTKEWKSVAYVLEDTAILSNDLEGINSTRVRRDAMDGKDISKQTSTKVARYIARHNIAEKMAGKERWNKEDKHFDFAGDDESDRPYIKMPVNQLTMKKRAESEDNLLLAQGAVVHKEDDESDRPY
eukprot:CAMPEP_0197550970 /NCGR_PEP_ID=MMETSP1320-20131121/4384_1 /TAXON_ID=91990 /ORGANISM="Bolidomonas sp., Strain RCC2347" /LENGTH=752 /DNA_ID=CAMNT_0043111405 /DNA_START=129 /DNA_END=2384 /DNA_ORIENTATION=-